MDFPTVHDSESICCCGSSCLPDTNTYYLRGGGRLNGGAKSQGFAREGGRICSSFIML